MKGNDDDAAMLLLFFFSFHLPPDERDVRGESL